MAIKKGYYMGEDASKKFLPANMLDELVTRDVVLSAFKETGKIKRAKRDRLVESILKGRQRLFLTLVLMTDDNKEKLSSLGEKEWDSVNDNSLPFTVSSDREFSLNIDGGGPQSLVPEGWKDNDLVVFESRQWLLIAPIFGAADKFFHQLTDFHRLPYLSTSERPRSSGFFSEVFRAEIHIAHIDARHIPAKSAEIGNNRDRISVAVKKARDTEELKEFFDKEAKNLERVQRIESEHIIKPIAAYQRGSERCLVFPWADGGNLTNYWETYDRTQRGIKNFRWIIEQLVGIFSALEVLHRDANNGYRGEKYGRHGDLKPENILWFKGDREGGCLKIADMGLTTFHDENANTKQRNWNNEKTMTPSGTFRYEPPEMDKDRASQSPRSRQYDIWSMGCIMIELVVWLLYGWDAVNTFRKNTLQFWERTSDTGRYYVSSYVAACLDVMEGHLEDETAYKSLLKLVRDRVLVVAVSDVYKSSIDHREIASVLLGSMETIQQKPDDWYRIPTGLNYPLALIEERRTVYFRPHSEGGRLTVPSLSVPAQLPTNPDSQHTGQIDNTGGDQVPQVVVRAPTIPVDSHLSIPESATTDNQEQSSKLNDIWESIPDNDFAMNLFKSLSWDVFNPPANPQGASLCSNCNKINSTSLFNPIINRVELELSAKGCDLCRLLRDALNAQELGSRTVVSLHQNGIIVGIQNGPNLLSIYVDPGLDLPQGVQLGLPKLPDHGSQEQLSLLKEWILICDSTHSTCSRFYAEGPDKNPAPTMPTRLVELGNPLRLVESVSIKPSPYVALSHCWGKIEQGRLCTSSGNITQLMASIDSGRLPKTFRDAILVTRGIGIEYLWIDSLCIIQDDKDDWENESAKMEQVFSFAYCTIGASSATSSVEGFLHKRHPRPCVQLETSSFGKLYVCQNIDNFHRDVDLGELNSRGWVLQERALSRRSIFYTSTQVYWECGEGIHCETLTRLKNAKAAFLGDARFPNSALEYYRDGRQMLVQDLYERYSRLAFTHYWDRPVAILGLQERLARAFKTQGAYGFFTTYFARLLLWKRSGIHRMTRIKQYPGARHRAPTWSWFSKVGAIKYMELKFQEIDWATRDFINPLKSLYYQPSRALDTCENTITLKGQARKLSLLNPELMGCATLDEDEERDIDVNDLRCVVIGRDKIRSNHETVKYHVLIIRLENVPGSKIYERVGVASMRPEDVGREGSWVTIQ
ncbi:hypothetical protein F5Y10DRAFT_289312 [Nemania abortiva]|nr:hypothetical protein F5Y10DRAFT_289312 [Nemania abortiva]